MEEKRSSICSMIYYGLSFIAVQLLKDFGLRVVKAHGSVVGYEVHRMVDCVSLVYFNASADVDESI